MSLNKHRVTVFAPATIANVAVGFDVLGFAFHELGDLVTVERDPEPGRVVLESVRFGAGCEPVELPSTPTENTATRALLAMLEDLDLAHGFRVSLEKGIPLGSGMGGSAASAVGAVVAADALLGAGLGKEQLMRFALAGEAAASGAAHGDNVAPCLFGGLCAYVSAEPPTVVQIPVPSQLSCVLVRPRLRQDTRAQRAMLADVVPLGDHARQTAHLTGFLTACFRDDKELLQRSMQDVVIGPQRGPSIPGSAEVFAAALAAGALGCGIAGSGPSLFAWLEGERDIAAVRDAMVGTLAGHNQEADAWDGPISMRGALVREEA